MKSTSRNKKGQSLIEAMVALSVLTMGFLGILTLLSKSFFYNREVSDTMKATYLASEGIEIAKNLVDHDTTLGLEGLGGGWGSCFATQGPLGFEADYLTQNCNALTAYNGSGNFLYYDSATHFYGYTPFASAVKTNFTREIMTTQNGDEIIVKSIVRWNTGTITSQTIKLEAHFYNWRPH